MIYRTHFYYFFYIGFHTFTSPRRSLAQTTALSQRGRSLNTSQRPVDTRLLPPVLAAVVTKAGGEGDGRGGGGGVGVGETPQSPDYRRSAAVPRRVSEKEKRNNVGWASLPRIGDVHDPLNADGELAAAAARTLPLSPVGAFRCC